MAQKDLLSRLADAGEEAMQRLATAPGAAELMGVATSMRDRVDEMQKRMRGIDALEQRVQDLERRLEEMGGTGARSTTTKRGGSSRSTTARKTGTTRKTTSSKTSSSKTSGSKRSGAKSKSGGTRKSGSGTSSGRKTSSSRTGGASPG